MDKRIIAFFVVTFIVLLASGFGSYLNILQVNDDSLQVNHTYTVLETLTGTIGSLTEAESNLRGFAITREPYFVTNFDLSLQKIKDQSTKLSQLTSDNTVQHVRAEQIQTAILERIEILRQSLAKLRVEPLSYTSAQKGTRDRVHKLMDSIRQNVAEMRDEELRILHLRQQRALGSTDRAILSLGVATAAGICLLGFLFNLTNRFFRVQIEKRRLQEIYAAELEVKVVQRTAQLKSVNDELEAFAYSVSHDLRAPLRAIAGFSAILMEDLAGKLDPEDKESFNRIRENVARMSTLIDDLLKLSRLTRGELKVDDTNLSELATETAERLQEAEPRLTSVFKIQPNVHANADPAMMKILLENLLSNAWKFTAKSERALIEFGSVQRDGKTTYFVKDSGIGLDATYGKKIFEPFQRLHTDREYPGTGIGLAICSRVIKRHGGEIWVESEPGKGATFYFTLDSDAAEISREFPRLSA